MKDLAPHITRQRLVIEGIYQTEITQKDIEAFLPSLAKHLNLRTYSDAVIFSPGDGKEENQGYDAFIPLIDSGISMYVWTTDRFFSIVLYTCKSFSNEEAIAFTKKKLQARDDIQSNAF